MLNYDQQIERAEKLRDREPKDSVRWHRLNERLDALKDLKKAANKKAN